MITKASNQPFEITQYGFRWGPAELVRLASDPKGWVALSVGGKRETVEIFVTKGGRIRIRRPGGVFRPLPQEEVNL